jgi:hypothetical protein
MLRTVRTFVITCTIYLLIYCSPEQGNYLPFDAGYNWTYQYIVGDSPDTRTVVIEIPRQTTLQGHEVWEKVETQTINSTVTIDTSFIEECDNKILTYFWSTSSTTKELHCDTSFVLPFENGKMWIVRSYPSFTTYAEVITRVRVNVLAGTFEDCWEIVYDYPDVGHYKFIYLAEDIGMIKSREGSAELILESYTFSSGN